MIGSCRRIKGRGEWREDSVRNGIWPKVREATWMGWDNKSSIPGNDGGKSFPVIASPLLSVLAVIRSPLIRRDIAYSPRERYWKRIVTWDWYKYLKEPLLFVFSFFLFFFYFHENRGLSLRANSMLYTLRKIEKSMGRRNCGRILFNF